MVGVNLVQSIGRSQVVGVNRVQSTGWNEGMWVGSIGFSQLGAMKACGWGQLGSVNWVE